MPVLKVDGQMYCQTQAVNAYCGKLAKLPALTDIEELKNHMMNETCNEVFAAMIKPAFAAIGGAGECVPHFYKFDSKDLYNHKLLEFVPKLCF